MRYPALAHRGFVLLWAAVLVSSMGTWMQNLAQGWLIYRMTGNDPMYLGGLGLAFAVPMVVLPPLGGVIADRVDRVRLLRCTQVGMMSLAGLVATLAWLEVLRPWHMLASTAATATLLAFDNPARQALVPELVPREALQNALSLNAVSFTGAALIGPAIAGVAFARIGAPWLFAMNAASFLGVIGALATLDAGGGARRGAAPLAEALVAGLAHVARDRALGSLLLVAAFVALIGRSYPHLLPIFADGFRAGPGGYGALLAAGGAGAVLGAAGLASLAELAAKGRVILAGGLSLAGALATFALAPTLFVGEIALVVAGAAATVFTTMTATLIQLRSPRELRGRIMSLYVVTLVGLPALGALGAAAAARALGDQGAAHAILGGAGLLVVGLAIAARSLVRADPDPTVARPS